MTSDFFKIKINGQQFRSAYLVYIVKLTSETLVEYFYIGQTGDRNSLTARPAFRRLAGHFSDQGYSTENQIYRQIAVKILGIESAEKREPFDASTKDAVTTFLTNCEIEMFVHPLASFLSDPDIDKHKSNRQLTEKIENELINYFITEFGAERILNKKKALKSETLYDKITIDIIKHVLPNLTSQLS